MERVFRIPLTRSSQGRGVPERGGRKDVMMMYYMYSCVRCRQEEVSAKDGALISNKPFYKSTGSNTGSPSMSFPWFMAAVVIF